MNAHLEPLAAVLRVFPDGQTYGSPYIWSATVRYLGKDTVEILGVCNPVTPKIRRAIIDEMRRQSIRKVIFVRRVGGRVRNRMIEVKQTRGTDSDDEAPA